MPEPLPVLLVFPQPYHNFSLTWQVTSTLNNPVYPTTGGGSNIGCYMIGSLTVTNKGTNNICTHGVGAACSITTGTSNTLNGFSAGTATTSGSNNTISGYNAGRNNTSGKGNTHFGSEAGFTNSTSDSNVCIGVRAGYTNDQSANVYIGARAGVNSGTGTTFFDKCVWLSGWRCQYFKWR